ncbi:MAG: hypothetical protein WC707_01040 [Candidatus Babeliaceae bacterium]|jgi:hypothetical protein
MNNFKKNMLLAMALCITTMPFMAQSGTILDVEEALQQVYYNRDISSNRIRTIIEEKVTHRQYDDIAVIERTLREYQDLLVSQSKTCISDNKLRFFGKMASKLVDFSDGVASLGESMAVLAGIAPVGLGFAMVLRAMYPEIIHPITNADIECAAACTKFGGISLLAAVGGVLSRNFFEEFIHSKIELAQLYRGIRQTNIETITQLLEYLNYEKGVAAGAEQVLSSAR